MFDSAYLTRGLAMYQSLARHCSEFQLHVLAGDGAARAALERLQLPNITLIDKKDFEDDALRTAKENRSRAEYFWTCTPSLIRYCLERYQRDLCTYLDADIYFFSDPAPLLQELGPASVMLTPHRYSAEYDRTETAGRYCVQFMPFRRDRDGMRALEWWRDACLDACTVDYARGLCGDQKYLDDWRLRFDGVRELQHLGGGVGPWNVQQYRFERHGARVEGVQLKDDLRFALVFYHFQGLRFVQREYRMGAWPLFSRSLVSLAGGYVLPESAVALVYRPYLSLLRANARLLRRRGLAGGGHGARLESASLWSEIRRLYQAIS